MNMFSSKEEVDQHVTRILNISKNQHDKDRQYLMIGKLYYDVKEFKIAKNYIQEFLKLNKNSQLALKLLGKIHENLLEFDVAAKYYERLYDIFKEKEFILKASETIIKCEKVNENKLKKFINILEKIDPNHEYYVKLKKLLSPNATFTYTTEDINDLKYQIKSNSNDELKIRFLRILENQTGVVDSLDECKSFIDNYAILDNIDAVKICLSIFQKYYQPDMIKFKSHFCLILIALFRNRTKTCDFDCNTYLSNLLDLLKTEKINQNNSIIFQLFIYYLTSIVHFRSIKENKLTTELVPAILRGYLIANFLSNGDKINFSPVISLWLRSQISLIKSISNHMIADDPPKQVDNYQCLLQLVNFIWDSPSSNSELSPSFVENFLDNKLKIKSTIEEDLQCLMIHFNDLKLICWQIMCYNKFQDKSHFNYQLHPLAYKLISSISNKIFSKVPLESMCRRSPENISKIDIITFILGGLLSYQKSFNSFKQKDKSLVFSFELWKEIRIPDVVHKSWEAIVDFTLLGRRNTSIGSLKDLLKSGLDSMQLVDNQMSDFLRLQMGKILYDCANHVDSERDLLKKRAVEFFRSVIQPAKSVGSFKSLSMSTYANSQSVINRQKSFTNSLKIKELFDTDYIGDDVINQWKLDAGLVVIDWRLQCRVTSIVEYEEIEKFIEIMEDLVPMSPHLYFMKARFCSERANSIKSKEIPTLNAGEYNQLLKSAQDWAHSALDCLDQLESPQKSEFAETVKQFLNSMASIRPIDNYSVMDLSVVGETCNSNRAFNTSIISNDFYNQSSVSDNQSVTIDNFKLNQLQKDIMGLNSSQEKIGSEISFCINKIDKVSKFVNSEFSSINNEIKKKNQFSEDLYQKLISKIDNLTEKTDQLLIKTDQLEVKAKFDEEEIEFLKKNVNHLVKHVNSLKCENSSLKNHLEMKNYTTNITENVIYPEMNKINNFINSNFDIIYKNANKYINKITEIKALKKASIEPVLKTEITEGNESVEKCAALQKCKKCAIYMDEDESCCPVCRTDKPIVQIQPNINLLKFSQNKWQCRTCFCMNDDMVSVCPACKTAKTIEKETNDLSKFSKNKWECPSCSCMNDDKETVCPACSFVKIGCNVDKRVHLPDKTNNESSFNFVSNFDSTTSISTPNTAFIFGISKTSSSTEKAQYVFGSSKLSEPTFQSNFAPNFGNSSQMSNFASDSSRWLCQCTTENKDDSNTCIACGVNKSEIVKSIVEDNENTNSESESETNSNSNGSSNDSYIDSDSDSDVILVQEQFVTEEQKKRARALKLPDHFYAYENNSDYRSDNESSNESDKQKQENSFLDLKSKTNSSDFHFNFPTKTNNFTTASTGDNSNITPQTIENEKEEEENPENFDPEYKPIISLPEKVEVITGEEDSECIFNEKCKLFKYTENEWKERGIGEMKILIKVTDNKKSFRLLMRREQVHKVCCNHAIVKECPIFTEMGNDKSTCWYAEDFSEGVTLVKIHFAIKFKTEELLKKFKDTIKDLQDQM